MSSETLDLADAAPGRERDDPGGPVFFFLGGGGANMFLFFFFSVDCFVFFLGGSKLLVCLFSVFFLLPFYSKYGTYHGLLLFGLSLFRKS